jgi:hypothetical protein
MASWRSSFHRWKGRRAASGRKEYDPWTVSGNGPELVQYKQPELIHHMIRDVSRVL